MGTVSVAVVVLACRQLMMTPVSLHILCLLQLQHMPLLQLLLLLAEAGTGLAVLELSLEEHSRYLASINHS